IIHCDLTISCKVTPGQFYGITIDFGGLGEHQFDATLKIVPGSDRTIQATSGDKQSGSAGQKLTQVLVSTIGDKCGSPMRGVAVNWTVTGSATLTNTVSTSNSNGQVFTGVVLGQIPGAVKITATLASGGASVSFNATTNVVVGSVSLVS